MGWISTRLMFRLAGVPSVLGLLSIGMKVPADSQTSEDFARMAQATWSAFECSTLATKTGDAKEQERLFKFGYEQGLKFIEALEAKRISNDDLRAEAPMVVLLLLQGPTPDFILGRIYQTAEESALEDVLKTGETLNPDESQKVIAQNKFHKANCELIGRSQGKR
jgi:hypothetical protein